jgi:hypothetical protein
MALHTSTIVMALITAVPFGLAIKDTAQGKTGYMASDEELDSEALDRYGESAHREYEEREAKEKAELVASIEKLIPMSAAGVLRGYEVNTDTPISSELQDRLEMNAHAVFTPARKPDGTLKTMIISFPRYRGDTNVCSLVEERLEEAWGSPSRTYSNGNSRSHYAAIKPQQRVTYLDPEGDERCSLVVEEYVNTSEYITKAETSAVPLWAIGKPAAKLVEKLGDDAFSDATQIRWNRPGVGLGFGETELYARIVKGKIVTITAKFQASDVSIGEVAEKLVEEHGAPEDAGAVVWTKSKLSLTTTDDTAGEYLLVAGEPLPDDSADEE